MKLSDQVVNLELSKRLKELGARQDSLFYWTIGGIVSRLEAVPILDSNYSALTVAELGEMLPWEIYINEIAYWYATGKTDPDDKFYLEHEVSYGHGDDTFRLERDDSEANARAKMLIYLIENNIWKPE